MPAQGSPTSQSTTTDDRSNGHATGYAPDASAQELPHMPQATEEEPDDRFNASAWGEPEEIERKTRTLYAIPSDSGFGGHGSVRANDLETIAGRLIDEVSQFSPLAGLTLVYYWKRRGGDQLAVVKRPDDFLERETEADLFIWLAADNLRRMNASAYLIEALIFDCLVQIDPLKPGKMPPDFKCNFPTLLRYSWFSPEARLARAIFQRVPDLAVDYDLSASAEDGDSDEGVGGDDDGE